MFFKVTLLCLSLAFANCALLGGYKVVDKNDKEVGKVVSFVESSLNAQSNSLFLSKIGDIKEVRRQLVNGFNYVLTFERAGTKCTKNAASQDLTACQLSGSKLELCNAKVYSTFSGQKNLVSFNCNQKKMFKRAGGIRKVADPSRFMKTAIRAISMSNAALSEVKIVSAKTQVVAGQNIFLTVSAKEGEVQKMCNITVWSRPWISGAAGFQVTKFQCKPEKQDLQRRRICAGCVSGEKTNPQDKQYKDLYLRAFALAKTNMDVQKFKILSVRTQVVAGIKYYMKVQTTEAGQPRLCDVQFVEQPWMNPSLTVLKFDCKSPTF